MDIIRSNYSTVGPYAQKEAPKPPEYPYTEIMAAYRGAFETDENHELESNHSSILKKALGVSTSEKNSTHTSAFERIIDHFFGDYFTVDADEELASDMAERWASFAREGNPNYDASTTEWLPWRHRPKIDNSDNGSQMHNDGVGMDNPTFWQEEEEDFWDIRAESAEYTNAEETEYFASDVDDDGYIDLDEMDEAEHITSDKPQSVIDAQYRKRALDALSMEVVDKDVFRTELRRVLHREGENSPGGNFLTKHIRWTTEEKKQIPQVKRAAQELLRYARQMGVVGLGLTGDDASRGTRYGEIDDDFFPELLELSWPPEGRLIEKDCSCEMWDRIRYRY